MTRALAALLFFAPALGCLDLASEDELELGSDQQAIVGGTINRGDPAVVAILATYAGGGQSLCTGTVISQDVILTAAHCLNGQPPESRIAFFGSDLTQGESDPDFIAAIDIIDSVYDVGFDIDNLEAGHDIGMVRLARPSPVPAIPLNTMPTSQLLGSPIRLTGFGRQIGRPPSGTPDDGGGAGIKRQVVSSIRNFTEVFQAPSNPPDLVAYGSNEENTCQGDSGGPNFVTVGGIEYVAGITSFGDTNCAIAGAGTRVDRYLPFIQAYVGGGAAACIDDGICESACAAPDPDCAADQCASDGVCTAACGAQDADCGASGAGNDSGSSSAKVVGGCQAGGESGAPWLVALVLFGLWRRRRAMA